MKNVFVLALIAGFAMTSVSFANEHAAAPTTTEAAPAAEAAHADAHAEGHKEHKGKKAKKAKKAAKEEKKTEAPAAEGEAPAAE